MGRVVESGGIIARGKPIQAKSVAISQHCISDNRVIITAGSVCTFIYKISATHKNYCYTDNTNMSWEVRTIVLPPFLGNIQNSLHGLSALGETEDEENKYVIPVPVMHLNHRKLQLYCHE